MNGGHYLKKTKADTMPSNAAVVAWLACHEKDGESDRLYRPGFVAGRLIRWRNRRGGQICRYSIPLATAPEMIGHLNRQAMGGSLTWVFTFGLRELLACCGFWDRVLAGEIDLWGDDKGIPRDPAKSGKRNWKGYVVLESPPAIVCCRFRPRGGTVKFVDLDNYNLGSWAQLARSMHQDKPSTPEDCHESFTLGDLIVNYAESAETWLCNTWQKMESENLGSWQATAASQAQYTFRRRFMDHDILAHENDEARKLERRALIGGRCESRIIGTVRRHDGLIDLDNDVNWRSREVVVNGPIFHVDVNSMYPAVARKASIPARLNQFVEKPTVAMFDWYMTNKLVIADVTVNVSRPKVPFVGERETVWPIGKFRTSLCGPELLLLYPAKEIVAVHAMAVYEPEELFTKYIDYFWSQRTVARAKGDKSGEGFAKRMLTSLFGKFAQRSKRWQSRPDRQADEPFDQWIEAGDDPARPQEWRSIAWEVEKLVVVGEHRQAVPAITAWINSLGRVLLWRMIEAAGQDHVFYFDTDSLWTTGAGLRGLQKAGFVNGLGLGQWKVAGEHRRVDFRGIKHYVADGWRVCAGLKPCLETEPLISMENMIGVSIDFDLANQEAPSGRKFKTQAFFNSSYRHGAVDPNGRVEPFTLSHQL